MSTFENVTIVKAANVYFDGKVTSRTIKFADGSTKSLGLMLPGEYEFGTDAPELMRVVVGELNAKLPGNSDWQSFKAGDEFHVPGDSKFQLQVPVDSAYLCFYG